MTSALWPHPSRGGTGLNTAHPRALDRPACPFPCPAPSLPSDSKQDAAGPLLLVARTGTEGPISSRRPCGHNAFGHVFLTMTLSFLSSRGGITGEACGHQVTEQHRVTGPGWAGSSAWCRGKPQEPPQRRRCALFGAPWVTPQGAFWVLVGTWALQSATITPLASYPGI